MVNPTTFSVITPALAGTALTYTACSASATGDIIPMASGAAMTVVLIKNSDAGGAHSAIFAAQADQWGVTSSQTVSVPLSSTEAVLLFPPSRWASATNTCAVTYGNAGADYTNLSIAVLQVPWSSH